MAGVNNIGSSELSLRSFYRVAGVATVTAGLIFRRNLAVEVAMFSTPHQPTTIEGWFNLLQTNRLLGLTYLNVFDLVNYVLVGLMFFALYFVLRRVNPIAMFTATAAFCVGIAVYFGTNIAFSMLTLSDQFTEATTEAARTMSLAAGQAMLAITRFGSAGAYPGTGGYMSLLLVAIAGLTISGVMMHSGVFHRSTAYVGALANLLDLAYCVGYLFTPVAYSKLMAVCFIPAAGLFLMIWHIMVGWKLFQLGRAETRIPSNNTLLSR